MNNKINFIIKNAIAGTIFAIFFVLTITLVSYAGSLQPGMNNGLSNGSPIASMLSLLDMAQTTSGTFDRTTDSLEAISNKIDNISNPLTPSFRAHMNGVSQTITSGQLTKLNFNTTYFDTTNDFNTTTYTYSPSIAGKYMFTANAQMHGATGIMNDGKDIFILIKGTGTSPFTMYGNRLQIASLTNVGAVNVQALVDIATGTDIEVQFYQGNGNDRDVQGSAAYTYFQGYKID